MSSLENGMIPRDLYDVSTRFWTKMKRLFERSILYDN